MYVEGVVINRLSHGGGASKFGCQLMDGQSSGRSSCKWCEGGRSLTQIDMSKSLVMMVSRNLRSHPSFVIHTSNTMPNVIHVVDCSRLTVFSWSKVVKINLAQGLSLLCFFPGTVRLVM